VAERAQSTYVITNNHFESKAGVNALELKAMISGKRVQAPPTLIQKYPELRKIATPRKMIGIRIRRCCSDSDAAACRAGNEHHDRNTKSEDYFARSMACCP
jgi:hypothetical protein